MAKPLIFGPDFGLLDPQKIFCQVLPLLVVRNCSSYRPMQFRGKLMNQLEKMGKKLILGLILACFGPNLVPKNLFVDFTSTRCYALLQAIIVCKFKEN